MKKNHESLFAYEKLKYDLLEESYLSIILFFSDYIDAGMIDRTDHYYGLIGWWVG
jgi:hypothetical protein